MDARLASGAQCSASRPLLAPKAAVYAAASRSTSGLTSPLRAWCLTGRRLRALHTVCMAHPRRVAKVSKQIAREVGELLLFDKVLQKAVCPEKRIGLDTAVSALASVTEVAVSGDLQVAKVYVSIFSDEQGKAVAMAGLTKLEGYVRKHIGSRMRLRLTPEIRFINDDSIQREERVLKILDQIKREGEEQKEAQTSSVTGGDWGDDEEDAEDGDVEAGDEHSTVGSGVFDDLFHV